MYERFTDRARRVMQLANQEAQRFNHEYIGTDHILLGLVKEGSGVAANVFKNFNIDLHTIRLKVEKLMQRGPDIVTIGKLAQTPRAKKVIEYSMEEARNLGHKYVGTEHILLGLLREDTNVAAQILIKLGLRWGIVRKEVLAILGQPDLEGDRVHLPLREDRHRSERKPFTVYPLSEQTLRRIEDLAKALAPLHTAKLKAVEVHEFERAAAILNEEQKYWRELHELNLPEYVLANVKHVVDHLPSRFHPILNLLADEASDPDARIAAMLPTPMVVPVRIVVAAVPRHPVSTLKAMLRAEDIGSPFFHAIQPQISPDSLARVDGRYWEVVRAAFAEVELLTRSACPVVVCVVRPRVLPESACKELFTNLRRSGCDFVVFDDAGELGPLLAELPPGTKVVGM